MKKWTSRAGLSVAQPFVEFVERELLPELEFSADLFWQGLADILAEFSPQNRALLADRDRLQCNIDAWHRDHRGGFDQESYEAFLRAIGYLQPEPEPFTISPTKVDEEVSQLFGPQLVVPATNARYALNAANARWGSLYDALYGTDAIPGKPATQPYDEERGQRVIARARQFLDEAVPLRGIRHDEVVQWRIIDGRLTPELADPSAFAGYRGKPDNPTAILLRHHGLHIELVFDRTTAPGRSDPAGLADVILEAALTTIVDLEDSVAAVDAEDKVHAYANLLGLVSGRLEASFEKGGRMRHRTLNNDRQWLRPDGTPFELPGRSLLFFRNVGLLMTTPMVRLRDGSEAPEGIVDAVVTGAIGMYDLRGLGKYRNSAAGSIYIVKPKLHGPAEASF
ncbi:MAG: malate synthase G, partial [Spongiibacteraceae bacterium]|nr:malate synthase G [Spongiibacteraceae bacterium]